MDALQAAKDMFPKMSNSEPMAPVDNVVVSTENLRQLEEGVSEATIQDSEQIMRNEFAALHNQFILLKQKHWLLLDTVWKLECFVEGIAVGLPYCPSTQALCQSYAIFPQGRANNSEDENDENERVNAADEETDDNDITFFDTQDFVSSSSFKSSGSDLQTSSFSSDEEIYPLESEDDVDPSIRSVENFPYINRRKRLPEPVEKETGVSLWSMINDNIGKDLTKVCLPVYFSESLSTAKMFEDL
ncbi:oxysterol-binding protein-related protein 1C-like [Actinidia eriantha]|uniref:oxysterol-binding protein-related protein 1C-like n=1 Tax=Actinidia eriantha TaxID=165200 RepID=UPI0025879365|nr:oxysterol-binding protein-related protein 1C-like [Actinidia eriantha]